MRQTTALTCIGGIGVLLRLVWLFQPVRYDEATTYLVYAAPGFHSAATQYTSPNNHVLHTLLVWACTRWTDAPWAIRLPAFVAGCAVPWLTFAVARRWWGGRAALYGAALAACSAHLIEYATNARGYSMMTAFALLQILFAGRFLRHARVRDGFALAVVTALGLYTVPVMVYPTVATAVWAAVVAAARPGRVPWRPLLWRAPLFAAASLGLTALLYLPVVRQPHGWENLTSNRWVLPLRSAEAWRRAANSLRHDMAVEWSLGLTSPGMIVLLCCAAIAIGTRLRRRDARPAWLLVAAAACVGLMLAQRVVPFTRVFGFLLPVFLATGGAGLAWLAARTKLTGPATPVLLCVALAGYVAVARLPDRAGAFDKFPDAHAVAKFLRPHDKDAVVMAVVPSAPLDYDRRRSGRRPFRYNDRSPTLWLVTRADIDPATVLAGHRLRADDFTRPRQVFSRGSARVYTLTRRVQSRDGPRPPPGATQPA